MCRTIREPSAVRISARRFIRLRSHSGVQVHTAGNAETLSTRDAGPCPVQLLPSVASYGAVNAPGSGFRPPDIWRPRTKGEANPDEACGRRSTRLLRKHARCERRWLGLRAHRAERADCRMIAR